MAAVSRKNERRASTASMPVDSRALSAHVLGDIITQWLFDHMMVMRCDELWRNPAPTGVSSRRFESKTEAN